jgi:hypothetical protein
LIQQLAILFVSELVIVGVVAEADVVGRVGEDARHRLQVSQDFEAVAVKQSVLHLFPC